MQILLPLRKSQEKPEADLAGPLVFCLLLGSLLLLRGKVHFGYIYGFGIVGCLAMYCVLNLMSENDLDVYTIVSILGYCLLPVVFLAVFRLAVDLRRGTGFIVALFAIAWCTITATRILEIELKMRDQRYLIAYPVFLLYSCFAMIVIF